MNKEFTIQELESYLNVTDNIINDLVRKGNINTNTKSQNYELGNKLNRLHYYRKQIISIIEDTLYETFNDENKE